jgi:RNA polymerase sigma-70 factor, ECF subfamily
MNSGPEDVHPDVLLVQRVVGGDRGAFEELYKKYVKKIFNLLYRMTGTAEEAEEITQEVFYQVYKVLPNFQGRSQFYTWIYRIATNVGLQHLKKRIRTKREVAFDDLQDVDYTASSAPSGDPHKESERRSFYGALHESINQLPVNQRMVMILGPIQGHSYQEMAEIMGTSEEVIKGRLHRARENIRTLLKSHR